MLTLTVTPAASSLLANPGQTATLGLTGTIAESDPVLSQVGALVYWGDGSSTQVGPGSQPLAFSLEHAYFAGSYNLRVLATNLAAPTPGLATFLAPLSVTSPAQPQATPSQPVTFGPIYPRFNGFPDAQFWDFSTGTDLLILEASVVSLLLTQPGERLERPTYGCALRNLVFELDSPDLQGQVTAAIAQAVATWEPRVQLVSATFTAMGEVGVSGLNANITVVFQSKLSNTAFAVTVTVSQ